jgi:hypothetical protein
MTTASELNDLINLKFLIEKECHLISNELIKHDQDYFSNTCQDLEISKVFEKYKNNMQTKGNEFIQTNKDILKIIYEILMKRCEHNWIDDVVETIFSEKNICYCNKCFIYK